MKQFHTVNILLSIVSIALAKNIVVYEGIGNCDENGMENGVHFESASWGLVSKEASEYNVTLVLKKDFDGFTGVVQALKCRHANGQDCEPFLTVPVPNLCNRLMEKGQFFSSFIQNMSPKLKCPPKKGKYVVTKARIEIDTLQQFVEPNTIVRAKFDLSDFNKPIGCIFFDVKSVQLKAKKKKSPN
ncbi:Hypothetical protein NTJ_04721 [Nesidiocoris tenuis]|uniref:MD-2-related lipid-recognition domain-containing protein n=1 Tax=Nesidiocoris tenuis TaxID=355587 RepID=A0ABN7AIY3_9HEMI|nr:Hypothetical protein NTJ_04721 [Nesidiocoris tenuis]